MSNNTFRDNEQGFVLVITMMILVTLTIIGITAIRSSRIAVQIAGNEKWSQQSFYLADGMTEVGTEIVEVSGTVDIISPNSAYTKTLAITGSNFDMNTADIAFTDIPALGGTLTQPSLVMPKDAVDGTTLKTIPASIVQMKYSTHASIGVDLNAVPGADAIPGSSQSKIQIQTRNYGTIGSVNDIEIYWLHVD